MQTDDSSAPDLFVLLRHRRTTSFLYTDHVTCLATMAREHFDSTPSMCQVHGEKFGVDLGTPSNVSNTD